MKGILMKCLSLLKSEMKYGKLKRILKKSHYNQNKIFILKEVGDLVMVIKKDCFTCRSCNEVIFYPPSIETTVSCPSCHQKHLVQREVNIIPLENTK
ncbi:hypothetical protein ACMX77_11135 [Bacillus subtilis]|uniref:hypothetical protein n=1 Tax=Bacillus subtilis TaxID=1423 RepID=UPI001C0C1703|nr:hypothetical protein [Bacillus subtilis]